MSTSQQINQRTSSKTTNCTQDISAGIKKSSMSSIDFLNLIETSSTFSNQALTSNIALSKPVDSANLNPLLLLRQLLFHSKNHHNLVLGNVLGKALHKIIMIGVHLMHYYTFSPKDYMSKTNFLEPMEDLAYRRLLDYSYLNERPLPIDIAEIALLICLRSHSDSIAVVLHYFFELTDDGYINDRVEKDVKTYQAKSDKARKSANARWGKNKHKNESGISNSKCLCERNASACETHDGRNTNYKQLTINEELETNSNKSNQKPLNILFDVFWKTYAKSAAKDKCEAKWTSLSHKVREQIMQHLPAYVTSTPVKKFRKDPYTYLNNKGWLDDIITNELPTNQQSASTSSMSVNAKYDDPNYDPLSGLFPAKGAV